MLPRPDDNQRQPGAVQRSHPVRQQTDQLQLRRQARLAAETAGSERL